MTFILGTAQFGLDYGINNPAGAVELSEIKRILNACQSRGVTTLDTAILYGRSEEKLGQAGVADWNVITKLPAVEDYVKDIHQQWSQELSASQKRLGVESFAAVMLHRPTQLLEARGADIYAALQRLKAGGIMRKVGISVYSPQEALDIASRFNVDLVQMPVSILDQRLPTSAFAAFAREHEIEIHARSIYLQGLLVMAHRPAWFAQWQPVFDEWQGYLERYNLSAVEACVRFVAAQKLLSGVVVGIDRAAQIEELLNFDLRPLSDLPQWPAYDEALINPSKWKLA